MAASAGRLPFIEPLLAFAARDAPAREQEWTAEAKWDGARVIAYISGGAVLLRSRTGRDITGSYPEVAVALGQAAGRRTLILDGKVVAFGGDRPVFTLLQRRMHVARPSPALVAAVPVTFIAFDLLRQASRSLLAGPYAQWRGCSTDSAWPLTSWPPPGARSGAGCPLIGGAASPARGGFQCTMATMKISRTGQRG